MIGPRAPRLLAPAQHLLQAPWLRQAVLLLRRSASEFFDDHCPQMSAAISFHLLFSIFPLAIVVIGAVGLITGGSGAQSTIVTSIVGAVPLSKDGKQQLGILLSSVSGAGGALGLLGIVGVVWGATGVMAAIRTALNIAWDTGRKRRFLRGKIVDLALVAFAFALTGATLGITLLASIARHGSILLPHSMRVLEPAARAGTSAGVYIIATGLLFATFLFLYRVVPAVPTRLHDVWPGALTAAVGFQAVQYGFSLYIAFFAHYNKVYGSLGAVVAFLFYIYLASSVFLFGAEVASEYPRMRPVP